MTDKEKFCGVANYYIEYVKTRDKIETGLEELGISTNFFFDNDALLTLEHTINYWFGGDFDFGLSLIEILLTIIDEGCIWLEDTTILSTVEEVYDYSTKDWAKKIN